MLTQTQTASQLGGRGEALRNLDDFTNTATELRQLCARVLQTNQRLIALLTQRNQPLAGITMGQSAAGTQSHMIQMQQMQQSFNMQYLALQQEMQDENRRFTLISNVMKTKHDTAKNAINNVR